MRRRHLFEVHLAVQHDADGGHAVVVVVVVMVPVPVLVAAALMAVPCTQRKATKSHVLLGDQPSCPHWAHALNTIPQQTHGAAAPGLRFPQ